jgi:hypothetical protein
MGFLNTLHNVNQNRKDYLKGKSGNKVTESTRKSPDAVAKMNSKPMNPGSNLGKAASNSSASVPGSTNSNSGNLPIKQY